MSDLDDFDLDGTKPAPPEPDGSGWGLRAGLAAGLLLLAGGLAAVLMLLFRHPRGPQGVAPGHHGGRASGHRWPRGARPPAGRQRRLRP